MRCPGIVRQTVKVFVDPACHIHNGNRPSPQDVARQRAKIASASFALEKFADEAVLPEPQHQPEFESAPCIVIAGFLPER
ncbi:MAG TPA: hypothetical protein VF447_04965 [Terriglobales bacterium]